MLIIWGRKIVRKKLGRVAEFCLICRGARACRVIEIRDVPHLYYLPVGRSRPVGHEVKCETCRTRLPTDVADYAGFEKDRRAAIDVLIERTNPGLEDRMIERLEIETRAAAGDASETERRELIIAPFIAIAPEVEARSARVHMDRNSAAWAFAAFVLPWALFVPGKALSPSGPGQALGYAGLAVAGAAFIMLLWSFATDSKRFIKRRYGRFVADALAELEPTHDELETTLGVLREQGLAVGRKARPRRVLELISEAGEERAAA